MSSIELDSDPSRVTAMSNSKSNYDTPSTEPVCKLSVMEIIAARYSGQTAMDKYQGKGEYSSGQGRYVGEFSDGTFHGLGTMYVKEGRFEGFWENGVMVDGIYIFDDELKYKRTGEKYWDYCSAHDYRFQKEILENVSKDGPLKYESNGYKENKIISFNETKNSKSNNNINNNNHNNLDKDNNKEYSLPINCYDFIEGYYDPTRNILCSHITKSDIRVPTEKEVEWILKNCRIGK